MVSTNPVTGEKQRVALTPEQEVAVGLQTAPEVARQFGGAIDHPMADYVKSVGRRVVERSAARNSPYRYDFHVLADAQTVNAFALPGGQIFITRALLSRMRSEAELAAVLGHEIGHVVGRHGSEHLAKQQLTAGLVSAVGVGTGDATAHQIAAAAGSLVNLKYGRDDELESDRLGVEFMAQAGYDANGMIRLMEVLSEAGGGRSQQEWTSTHPNPERRMERLAELVKKHGGSGGETNEERYAERVLKHL
jgi:predicted Zn-dependent protease